MKRMHIMGLLFLFSGVTFAETDMTAAPAATDLNTKWTCSTNATSSDSGKALTAERKMSKPGPVMEKFKVATDNCRDCTKITCEMSK